jgi:dissimilatory sulfite reductase (desulfoviridin) alpha/beta subunit
MIRRFLLIFFGIAGIVTFIPQSCVNNNEIELYGIQKCDTTNVTWNSKIATILENNCVICHNAVLSYNGVRHDSYAAELIVVNNGKLRGVVNHLEGFSKMPKDRDILPPCELELINIWLDNGAPEN